MRAIRELGQRQRVQYPVERRKLRLVTLAEELTVIHLASSWPLDLEACIGVLDVRDQSFECRVLPQVLEVWVEPEKGPAGIARIDTALQPRHSLVRFAQ